MNSKDTYIPFGDKYRNDFSLSLIANAILFGGKYEGYEELYDIGMKIYQELAEKTNISLERIKSLQEKEMRELIETKRDKLKVSNKLIEE